MFAHVAQTLEGVLEDLDPDDEAAVAAVARLRQECTQAKEALSSDSEATIPVLLPNAQADVRITREQFEEMIRPDAGRDRHGHGAGHALGRGRPRRHRPRAAVGGSSRIPLVGQLVSAGLGRPVAIDAHPKHAIALGAAHVAARAAGVATAGTPTPLDPGRGRRCRPPSPRRPA